MSETTLLTSGHLNLPDSLASGIWQKVQDTSAIARLAGTTPMVCSKTDFMTFTGQPKAEFVGEGAEKSPAKAEFSTKTAQVHKAQVTVRFNEEVQYEDTDRQVGALSTLRDSLSVALARALDLGAIHGINPMTGINATTIQDKITNTTITISAVDPETDIENASGSIINKGYVPTGLAIDPMYAWKFKTAKFEEGRKKYPELSMNIKNTSMIEGLTTAVSDTVSASREASEATGVCGVVGQWDAFKWGIVRDIPVEVITYGDPDGQGDLKRKNQIALRAEVLYSWAILDNDAFAVIKGNGGSVVPGGSDDTPDGSINWKSTWDEMTKGDIIDAMQLCISKGLNGGNFNPSDIMSRPTKQAMVEKLNSSEYPDPQHLKTQLESMGY